MEYNYNFALCSIFFFSLTLAFYFRQQRLRDLKNHLFTLMLCGGLVAVVLDFTAAALEPIGSRLPLALLYMMNSLFIIGEQLCLPAFFFFSVALVGRYYRMSLTQRVLALIPFILILGLLAISPFGQSGLFYIDAAHIYRPGAAHWALYAASGLYVAASCLVLAKYYQTIQRIKRVLILVFILILLAALTVQILYPRYLLATSATALALTAMYYVLRDPGEQVDPFTGAFYRNILTDLLQNRYERKSPCSLVLFVLLNYNDVCHSYGAQQADALLRSLSHWLRAARGNDIVVYMNGAGFAVLIDGQPQDEALDNLWRQSPDVLRAEGNDIHVRLGLAAMRQEGEVQPEQILTAADHLFMYMQTEQREGLFVADSAYVERCNRLAHLEGEIQTILEEARPELVLEPIFSPGEDNRPAAVEASLILRHPVLAEISPRELQQAISNSGNIPWYYRQLISLVSQDPAQREQRFFLPLLGAALIREDLARLLSGHIAACSLAPGSFTLCLGEMEASGSLPVVRENLISLAKMGFGLRLDDFAEGYTDLSLLTDLPISTVQVDSSLLHRARTSPEDRELLACVIRILRDVGKEVICSGVDTPADAELARSAGAALVQGKWRKETTAIMRQPL